MMKRSFLFISLFISVNVFAQKTRIDSSKLVVIKIHEKREYSHPLYVLNNTLTDSLTIFKIDKSLITDVNVLNGAEAVAKYGATGKNGAIIVTTKQKPK